MANNKTVLFHMAHGYESCKLIQTMAMRIQNIRNGEERKRGWHPRDSLRKRINTVLGDMVFLHAFGGIFSLLLVVILGYVLAWKGWFGEGTVKLLPRLVTNVSLPPFLCCTIISSFQRDNLFHMLYGAFAPFLAMCLLFALAYATGRIMRVSKRHFGLFCACVSNPNTIFIGIPVNLALFGAEAIPFVLLYYFASTFFFWTVGNYFIGRDESAAKPKAEPHAGIQWQRLVSAPMLGFLSGLGIVCLDLHMPDFLFQAASLTGQLTTPLALIFIGITLRGMGLGRLKISRDIIMALCGRMIISPLLMWALLPLFQLPALMEQVFIIQSSLPVLMQVAILSAYYNTDPEFGSIMVSLSTIFCVLTVPVYMAFL